MEILKKLGFSEDAISVVTSTCDKIMETAEFVKFREDIVNKRSFTDIQKDVVEFSEEKGMNYHSVLLTVLASNMDIMENRYKEANLSEEMFFDMAKDLWLKARECNENIGVWGIKSFLFFQPGFELNRFAFGCLQYNHIAMPDDIDIDNVHIKKGADAITIHIPFGTNLEKAAVLDSMKKAAEFFGPNHEGKTLFNLQTWFIYPPYVALYKDGSNLKNFAELFTYYKIINTEDFDDAWRLFNTEDISDLDKLPCDTSLRRSFIEYMKNNPKYGKAAGFRLV